MTPFLQPTFLIGILIALSVHEWAHAFVADRLGDPTPRDAGRLTLNPIAHLDPLGALMFLFVGFGWGKPVPIDPRYFRHPKRDSALVAFAGPLSNLILAFACFIALASLAPGAMRGSIEGLLSVGGDVSVGQLFLVQFFTHSLFVNVGLMAFNLLPVAPLDGSKVVQAFIPLRYEDAYEDFMRYGPYILIGMLIAERLTNFSLLSSWMLWIMEGVLRAMMAITGG
jgi:Zn-dependent protease